MNTMVATTAIAVGARELALTLERADRRRRAGRARATAAVASGRVRAVLAGGVDELDPVVERELERFGFDAERRSEGAAFLVLEPRMSAEARGAPVLGEISAAAWRALPRGPGRGTEPPLARDRGRARGGRARAADLGWVYASGSCDDARDRWEEQVLGAALGSVAPVFDAGRLLGRHAGLGVLRVAAGVDRTLGTVAGTDGATRVERVRRDEASCTGWRAAVPTSRWWWTLRDSRGRHSRPRRGTTVGDVVRGARRYAPVIVVDDGSTDGTAAAARGAGAEVLMHARRRGKAEALRTGVAAARTRGVTHVVTLDADGQHHPDDMPALLAAAGPRTLVMGTRPLGAPRCPRPRRGIVVASFFVNWASGLQLATRSPAFASTR